MSLRRACLLVAFAAASVLAPAAHASAPGGEFVVTDAASGAPLGAAGIVLATTSGTSTVTRTVAVQWHRRGAAAATVAVSGIDAFVDGASASVSVLGQASGTGVTFHDGTRVLVRVTVTGVDGVNQLSGLLVASTGHTQRTLSPITVAPTTASQLKIANASGGTLSITAGSDKPVLPIEVLNTGSVPVSGVRPTARLIAPDGTDIEVSFPDSAATIPAGGTVVLSGKATLTDSGSYTGFAEISTADASAPLTASLTVTWAPGPLEASTTVQPAVTTDFSGDAETTVVVRITGTGQSRHTLTVDPTPAVTQVDAADKPLRAVAGAHAAIVGSAQGIALPPKGSVNLPVRITGLPGRGSYDIVLDVSDERGEQLSVPVKASVRQHASVAAVLIGAGVLVNALLVWMGGSLTTKARRGRRWADSANRLKATPLPQQAESRRVFDSVCAEAAQIKQSLGDSDADARLTSLDVKTQLLAEWIKLVDRAYDLGMSSADTGLEALGDNLATGATMTTDDLQPARAALDAADSRLLLAHWLARVDQLTAAARLTAQAGPPPSNLDDSLKGARDASDVAAAATGYAAAFAIWRDALAADLNDLANLPVPWALAVPGAPELAREAATEIGESPRTAPPEPVADQYLTAVKALLTALITPADGAAEPPAVSQPLAAAARQVDQGQLVAARTSLTDAIAAHPSAGPAHTTELLRGDVEEVAPELDVAAAGGTELPAAPTAGPWAPPGWLRTWTFQEERKDAQRKLALVHALALVIAVPIAIWLGIQALYLPNTAWGTWTDVVAALVWGLALGTVPYAGVSALRDRLVTPTQGTDS